MLAIHNLEGRVYTTRGAANAFAKLSKCQQFTTAVIKLKNKMSLQTLLQSYQNVSNSQQFYIKIWFNLAANAFAKLSKCQQFTTITLLTSFTMQLQTLLQSYQNVSNSQRCTAHVFSYIAANAFAKLSKCQQFTTFVFSL